jgi:hypothetical protein
MFTEGRSHLIWHVTLLLFSLLSLIFSASALSFYEPSPHYPSISFQNISIADRHLYLNPSASSIPCGYMIPTDLDIFRLAPSPGAPTAEFNPHTCTVMIVRLLFGAYEIFTPMARKYAKLTPKSLRGETYCYILITDSLSLQHPVVAQSIFPNSSFSDSENDLYPPEKYCHWHVYVMKNLIYPNPAKTMKVIKLSLFRLFPMAKFILYYDLKYQMKGNPVRFLEICGSIMERLNVSYAIYRTDLPNKTVEGEFVGARARLMYHHSRGVVHDLSQELDDLERQKKQYEAEGFFDLVKGNTNLVVDSAILVLKNEERTQRLFCAWMNEVIFFSRRDQLSYSYVEHRLNISGFKFPPVLQWRYFQKHYHKHPPRH